MKKICVVTATRAEYGLLKPLIKAINETEELELQLVVTGTHLSDSFGNTISEIESDGFVICKKVDILDNTVSATMAKTLIEFEIVLNEVMPSAVVLLGDRYETMAVACVATNLRIPVIHLYGGDTTEGAIDEAYRHSITKMSYLHFTSCEESRKRVIQLGEQPDRVFNAGSLALDNIKNEKLLTQKELENELGLSLINGYAVVTFHPVTLENQTAEIQCHELMDAISERDDLSYIITKSNADSGGTDINKLLDDFGKTHKNVLVTESLGMRRYLSALKYSNMVIGNSSSGIYEAPMFHVPTINMGDRQKGRLQAASIINCQPDKDSILDAMNKAEDRQFLTSIKDMTLPYGEGNAAELIVDKIISEFEHKDVNLKKQFYNYNML